MNVPPVISNEQIDKVKIEVQQFNDVDTKRTISGPSMNLDIPESIGLTTPQPASSASRLMDLDIGKHGKRRI